MQTEGSINQKIKSTTKTPEERQFLQNKRFFLEIRGELLKSRRHRGKFVAIYNGKIVGQGEDRVKLALTVYNTLGYVPIYIGKVDAGKEIGELPSPEA